MSNLIRGTNDLETLFPEIAAQWDKVKNHGITPADVLPGSEKAMWWRCSLGHSWKTAVSIRTSGCGCPYCAGQKVLKGFNDLATTNPQLASQWDSTRNCVVTPDSVMANSNKYAWWLCEKGHSWRAVIASRNAGRGCPVCGNRRVLPGENDLATLFPRVASDWNQEKNGTLTPNTVAPYSHRKVWWKDELGHEWQARIANRTNGDDCPYCTGKQALPGFNDLATKDPQLAEQWDHEKNGDRIPENMLPNSHRNTWWICPKGHSWTATVASRHFNKCGCPYCGNRKALPGETDFATAHPELMKDWDFDLNQGIDPTRLTHQARKMVHWKCEKGHSWYAGVYDRVHGRNCPYCNYKKDKHIVVPGVNDLETARPDLAKEWDTQRNGNIGPENISPHSNRQFWWKCKRGHHWTAKPNDRLKGNGCPYCDGKTPIKMRIV